MSIRLFIAGLALAFSTTEVPNLLPANASGGMNLAAAVGPARLGAAVGAISAHAIDRTRKGDLLILRPEDISAGYIKTVSLFDPIETGSALPKMAFVRLERPVAVAAAMPADATGVTPKVRPEGPEADSPRAPEWCPVL